MSGCVVLLQSTKLLCWSPCPMWPPRAPRRPRVWDTTCVLFRAYDATWVMQFCVACSATPCRGDMVWARAAAEDQVSVRGLCSHGLCWCLRFLLLSKTTWMPEIWGRAGVQKSHNCSCADLGGLHCHLVSWWHPDPAVVEDHICVCGSVTARVCVATKDYTEAQVRAQSVTLLVSGAMLPQKAFWSEWPVFSPRARKSSRSVLLSRAVSGFMVLKSQGDW